MIKCLPWCFQTTFKANANVSCHATKVLAMFRKDFWWTWNLNHLRPDPDIADMPENAGKKETKRERQNERKKEKNKKEIQVYRENRQIEKTGIGEGKIRSVRYVQNKMSDRLQIDQKAQIEQIRWKGQIRWIGKDQIGQGRLAR